jgi:hypothetical protein
MKNRIDFQLRTRIPSRSDVSTTEYLIYRISDKSTFYSHVQFSINILIDSLSVTYLKRTGENQQTTENYSK